MSQKCQHARDLWSQLDALRLGMNYSKEDVNKLQVLVDDCYGESHPGSFHLNQLGDEAVLGVHESGGRAVRHHVTDICDGWGQGHDGMNYILHLAKPLPTWSKFMPQWCLMMPVF